MFLGKRRTRFRIGPSRAKRFLKTFSVILFILISIYIFVPYSQEKDDVSAVVDPTIPSTITFTELNNVASITVKPSRVGAFVTTSGNDDIRFNITTTNYTGYTLTARSSKTTLDKGNDSLPTLTSAVTAEQFANSGNTPLSNRWGYKPNYFNSAPNSNYLPSPTSSGTILDATTEANSTAKNYNISLGARIDLSLPYGSYLNTVFSLEATANAVPYRIVFNGNGGDDTVSNLPSTLNSEAVTATTISLPNTTPTRPNHSFAGWCTVTPTRSTGGNETCSGTMYSPGDIYAIDYTSNNSGIILSAIWTLNITCNSTATTIATGNATDAVCIQDMNNTIAATMTTGVNYRLIDVRDGTYYHLAKLLDGEVWMTDNLDLGRVNLTSDLTSSNTNLSTTVTAATFNGWKKTSGSSTYDAGEFINVSGTDSTSGTPYGTLYNYYAASAGTISGSSNSNNATYDICPAGWRLPTSKSSGEFQALYDEYNSNALMRAPVENSGAAFALAGYFITTPTNQDSVGRYWSSTWGNSTYMYFLFLNKSQSLVYPSFNGFRYDGNAIRCVAKKPTHALTVSYSTGVTDITVNGISIVNGGTINLEEDVDYSIEAVLASGYRITNWSATSGTVASNGDRAIIYTMGSSNSVITTTAVTGPDIQNLSASSCTSTASYAKDTRDNHVYIIQRLDDGVCWMMENLDLGRTTLTTDLTSSNTNLATTVTASTFNGWKKSSGSSTYDAGEFINISGTDSTSGTPYGTLYNYYATTAGTISGQTNSGEAIYDICPAGWRLPNYNSYGSFTNLYAQYNSVALMRLPIADSGAAIAFAGFFTSGSPYDVGTRGIYWTSTYTSNGSAWTLDIDESRVSTGTGWQTSRGQSVRCVLKNPYSTLTISYGTGISSVEINGQVIADGGTISLEQGVRYSINATTSSDYTFNRWSATAGSLFWTGLASSYYTMASSDATLTATATFTGTYIQNLDSSNCTSTASTVYDSRDMHTYTIQRLNDGNCWMMENLDLGRTSITTDLTSANTNLATTVTASTFNSWKKDSGTGTYDAGELISVSGTDSTSGTPYGTLYNYYAASAGTISGSTNSNNASYDICPAGWRLPTGGSSGEFQALYTQYNSNALMRAPITENGAAFALAGYFSNAAPASQGSVGNYWSSTRFNGSSMYRLFLNTSGVYPASSYLRSDGYAIRCVAKKPAHTLTVSYGTTVSSVMINGQSVSNGGSITLEEGVAVSITMSPASNYVFSSWSATSGTISSSNAQTTTYRIGTADATLTANAVFNGPTMQNLSASDCTSTARLALDTRDNHVYTIKRMSDGVCWMTENLELGATDLSVALTSANSNLYTTIPAATFNGWRKTSGSSTYTAGEYIQVSGNDAVNGSPYGVLYNYYAASGGTITGSTNTSDSTYDICPAGWRLPSGTRNTGEFQDFANYYSTNTVLQQAVSSGGAGMTLSGIFTNSTPTSKDWLSSYWSSSVADSGCFSRNGKMLGFEFTNSSSTVYADACNDRASGHLIRCVLDESKISDLTYLQDFASLTNAGRKGVIASMGLGTQYQLTDIRDNKKYYIAKLADGNVWMTQNLDLDLETSPVNVVALTPANTDIPSNWTPSSATRTNTSWTFTTTAPQSYNPGTKYWNGNTHDGSGTSTSYISNSGTAQYHLGNYYNWTAAVALNNSSSYTTAGVLLDQSICPAGWTLPRGGYGASTYYTLSYQYSGNIWLSPTYFALSGTWGGSYDSVGFTAMYWATGAKNADRAYYADFSSDGSRNVGTGGYDRDMGLPVRCIARPAAAYITQ